MEKTLNIFHLSFVIYHLSPRRSSVNDKCQMENGK